MKRINILLALLLVVFACKNQGTTEKTPEKVGTQLAFSTYGEEITDTNAQDHYQMLGIYQGLESNDTSAVKFRARVKEVCQSKGCWMKLALPNGQETRVKFKDYGFFVPKDIAGKLVVVEGKAFLEELSVEEQQHYAEEGQSNVDPESITSPATSFGFLAHGVLVAQE